MLTDAFERPALQQMASAEAEGQLQTQPLPESLQFVASVNSETAVTKDVEDAHGQVSSGEAISHSDAPEGLPAQVQHGLHRYLPGNTAWTHQ